MFSRQRSGVIYCDNCRQRTMSLMLLKMRQKNQRDFISSFTTVSQRRYLFTKTHAICIAPLSMTIRVQGLPCSLYKASRLSASSRELCSPSNSQIYSRIFLYLVRQRHKFLLPEDHWVLHVTKIQSNTFVSKI